MAAVINSHTFSSFKQYKFITLQFWRSEAWHKPYWAETKVSARLHPFLSLKRIFFLLLKAICIPPTSHRSDTDYLLLPPLWSHWAHPDNAGDSAKFHSLLFRTLFLSATLIHICHIKCIHRSIELEHLWDVIILLPLTMNSHHGCFVCGPVDQEPR